MSDTPAVSQDLNYLFPLAEKELRVFFYVVHQLFGLEQARRSALDWIHEIEVMNWPAGEATPDWRQATIKAIVQLCSSRSVVLQRNATKIDSSRGVL